MINQTTEEGLKGAMSALFDKTNRSILIIGPYTEHDMETLLFNEAIKVYGEPTTSQWSLYAASYTEWNQPMLIGDFHLNNGIWTLAVAALRDACGNIDGCGILSFTDVIVIIPAKPKIARPFMRHMVDCVYGKEKVAKANFIYVKEPVR